MNLFSVISLKIRSSYNTKIETEIEKIEKLTFLVKNVCRITFITGPRLKQTKSESIRLPRHFFSIDCDISDPLFTSLWALFTDLVLIQVNACFYTPILNYILPSLYNSELLQTLSAVNAVNRLLKCFNVCRCTVLEYLEITFRFTFKVSHYLIIHCFQILH